MTMIMGLMSFAPTALRGWFFPATQSPIWVPQAFLSTAMAKARPPPQKKDKQNNKLLVSVSKRELGLSILLGFPITSIPVLLSAAMVEEQQLERYTDAKEGFTFLRPSSWIKVQPSISLGFFFSESSNFWNDLMVVLFWVFRWIKLERRFCSKR